MKPLFLSNLINNRITRAAKQLILSPYFISREVLEHYWQDGVRIKKCGAPAYVVGGALAAITMPFRRIIIPATLAGRIASGRKSPKAAVVAGITGAAVGTVIVAYFGELAIILYVLESMTMAATASNKAEEKSLKAIQTKPSKNIDSEILVG